MENDPPSSVQARPGREGENTLFKTAYHFSHVNTENNKKYCQSVQSHARKIFQQQKYVGVFKIHINLFNSLCSDKIFIIYSIVLVLLSHSWGWMDWVQALQKPLRSHVFNIKLSGLGCSDFHSRAAGAGFEISMMWSEQTEYSKKNKKGILYIPVLLHPT